MVRLKPPASILFASGAFEFQFQNGTIKAILQKSGSHNKLSFNSKMVRLKPGHTQCPGIYVNSFNSKMVRLKRNFGDIRRYGFESFQFQNGTIKAG